MSGINEFTVYKCDPQGNILWQYQGELLRHEGSEIILEALFNWEETPFQGITIKNNDRFIETFYTDRWYNFFEIHDREDDQIKGWYCNVGRPAVLKGTSNLSYQDLALDLWVGSDGTQQVLDEDEFSKLDLDDTTRGKALAALKELQDIFTRKFNNGS
jgi:hypothetical protein